ncbi:Peptidase M15 [Leptospira santarosai]|nr:Peptidase M15 [Leptospira santarosai]
MNLTKNITFAELIVAQTGLTNKNTNESKNKY